MPRCPMERVQLWRGADGRTAYARLPPLSTVDRLYEALRQAVTRPGAWASDGLALTAFLAYTGARISEATAVKVEDLDWDRGLVRLKTQKTRGIGIRVVPLPVEVLDLLRMYAARRGRADVLFPLPRTTAYMLVRRATGRLLGCWLPPHALRHAYAVRALRDWGYTPGELREMLGHSSVRLTELYVRYLGYRPPERRPTL